MLQMNRITARANKYFLVPLYFLEGINNYCNFCCCDCVTLITGIAYVSKQIMCNQIPTQFNSNNT